MNRALDANGKADGLAPHHRPGNPSWRILRLRGYDQRWHRSILWSRARPRFPMTSKHRRGCTNYQVGVPVLWWRCSALSHDFWRWKHVSSTSCACRRRGSVHLPAQNYLDTSLALERCLSWGRREGCDGHMEPGLPQGNSAHCGGVMLSRPWFTGQTVSHVADSGHLGSIAWSAPLTAACRSSVCHC